MEYVNVRYVVLFFFKQKTAYEMRISDWSSDVCSSDLGEQACGDFLAVVRLRLLLAVATIRRPVEHADGVIERVVEQAAAQLHAIVAVRAELVGQAAFVEDRKSTRLNSSH